MKFSIPINKTQWVTAYTKRLAGVTSSVAHHVSNLTHTHSRSYCVSQVSSRSSTLFIDKKIFSSKLCSDISVTDKTRKRFCVMTSESDSSDDILSDSEFENNVFIRRKLLEREELDALRVILYPSSKDDILNKITEANSVQEVFDLMEKYDGCITAEHLSQAIVTLWDLQKIYGRYGYECSMITKIEIKDFLETILNHPIFEQMIRSLVKNCDSLNNTGLTSMLLYLNKLGVKIDSNVMQILSVLCLKRINTFNLTALSRLSVYLRDQGIRSYFMQSKLLPLIARKLDNRLDVDEFHMMTICLNSTRRLLTKSLIEKYVYVVEKNLNEGFFESCDPKITLKVIKLLSSQDYSLFHRLVQPLMFCLRDNFHTLSDMQVIDLNNYFQNHLEPLDIFRKLCQYSSNTIKETKVSGARPDILWLAPYTSMKMRNYFERLIVDQLEEKDFYDLIVAIFKVLRYFKTSNTKLCDAFWMRSLKSVEDVLERNSDHFLGMSELIRRKVYQRYMYFNNNLGGTYRNITLEKTMSKLLLEDLKTPVGLIPNKVANIAAFIISYSPKEGIPEFLFEKLMLCCPQFSLQDAMNVSRGIQISLALNKKGQQRRKIEQISTICHMLDAKTEDYMKEAKTLTDIITLARGYLNRHGSPRTFIFDGIISACLPHLDELNSRHIRDLALCFMNTLYIEPRILEAMSEYILENKECILVDIMEVVLTCFYNIGYTPVRAEELLRACGDTFIQESHLMRGLSIVQMCLAMNMNGYLPSEVIQKVFNLKFMDQLDEEIDKCYSKAIYPLRIRHLLMELNRAVCLDHPEENIPWFHEKYCEEYLETVAFPTTVFHKEVHEALEKLIGGSDVLTANVHTPYYYFIDFEFVLDEDNNPVPVKDYTPSTPRQSIARKKIDMDNKPGHRRVAVIVRKESHYCINKRQLLGRHQVESRHLELMGYTVVEVPHFIWYSMVHATQEDKIQYLKDQIFPVR